MDLLDLVRRRLMLPQDLSRLAINANRFKLFGFPIKGSEENAIIPNAGRRMARRQPRLPQQISVRSEVNGWPFGVSNASSVGSTELRPGSRRTGASDHEEQSEQQ